MVAISTSRSLRSWCVRAVLCTTAIIIGMRSASAYRPFDGTDAAVAAPGEMEIEFQPAGVVFSDAQKTLIAPATVLNFGLPQHWEAVLESQDSFGAIGAHEPFGIRRIPETCLTPRHFAETAGP